METEFKFEFWHSLYHKLPVINFQNLLVMNVRIWENKKIIFMCELWRRRKNIFDSHTNSAIFNSRDGYFRLRFVDVRMENIAIKQLKEINN